MLELLRNTRHVKVEGEVLSVQAAYDRADEAIRVGYEATISKLEDIERLQAVLV